MSCADGSTSDPVIFHPDHAILGEFHDQGKRLKTLAEVLEWEASIREDPPAGADVDKKDRLQEIWFRGQNRHHPLCPGIYREHFTNSSLDAVKWGYGDNPIPEAGDAEWRRLNLEREMVHTFRSESGSLLQFQSAQELYFLARHHGVPSRLLDWSISPLIALFMCVFEEPQRDRQKNESTGNAGAVQGEEKDGVIYAMDPTRLDPQSGHVFHQQDPRIRHAIDAVIAWTEPEKCPAILPIRPYTLPGRIDRQMSRFTLHCYGAAPQANATLRSVRIHHDHKRQIRAQLERIGVNQFSVYYTLDRLAQDVVERFRTS